MTCLDPFNFAAGLLIADELIYRDPLSSQNRQQLGEVLGRCGTSGY